MEGYNIIDVSKIGLYGLTYKENVDDTRESPSIQLIEYLNGEGIKDVKSYDPYLKDSIVENQVYDFDSFLNATDLIIIMVSHQEIKNNQTKLLHKIVFDTKNVLIRFQLFHYKEH